jgi:flagellar hook-associated protein 3 FlgL
MQISTLWGYQVAVENMTTQQSNLSQTQMQISTGKQYLTPADNPVVAANLIDFNQNIQENQQYQTNISSAQSRLQLEDSSLSSAISTVQSIQELTTQGLNASNSAANKQQIANQINQLNQQLLTIANTKDANGEYIFSGNITNQQAYTVTTGAPNTYTYNGDSGQQSSIIGPNRQVTQGDPGSSVFGAISTGTLTEGSITNVFQAVNQIVTDLNNNTPSNASLTDLSNALNTMETTQASVGSRLQVLTSQQNINAQTILDNQTTSSAIGDLNMPQAISQLDMQQTTLQAAQMAFTKVEGMSLFQYM